MLSIVVASSILALILLSAAIVEQVGRWAVEIFGRRTVRQPGPASFEAEDRFGLLAKTKQL
jgi:hypothetical protein